ncbi:Rrm1 protein [Ephemerocybe angulata]|uniref:Ribonucleoside-diphosphate reductase n=1 Tax=Ephemerocybe angulata TaxID=980116 RepID=A0A8H6M7X9_9AGAR|nr:Rrm1 protein [Tulosesus angulatus]
MPPWSQWIVVKRDGSARFPIWTLQKRIMTTFDGTPTEKETSIGQRVLEAVVNKIDSPIESRSIDSLIAETANPQMVSDPIYGVVAARIELSSIYKETESTFSAAMGRASSLLSGDFMDLVNRHACELDDMIQDHRDTFFSFLALRSLRRTYLLKGGGRIFERPQFLFLRVAVALHGSDLDAVYDTYSLLSQFRFMFASPTYFNAGTKSNQLSSCFLLPARREDDIFQTLSATADISRGGGGIGMGIQSIPAKGFETCVSPESTRFLTSTSFDRSVTKGIERRGIVPVLKMFDSAVDVIDQGMNKRPSAIAAYIEPWHAEIFSFVRMRRNKGTDSDRTNRLFYGLWVNDLFMQRVEADQEWTLFCPSDVPSLVELFEEDFNLAYERYEAENLGKATVRARDLWSEIVESLIETGGPYILFKDSINTKSNQSHNGTITHGNLCTEIVQYSNRLETAVCTLASVVLPTYVRADNSFDYAALEDVVRQIVFSLNRLIQKSSYPDGSTEYSAKQHRAIGIGVQGLADALVMMGLPFDSDEALEFNAHLAECIYFAALDESCNMTRVYGAYPQFPGSPTADGILQFDFWDGVMFSGRYDWSKLREKVVKGLCNSLVTAFMPTAGTTTITGCSESTEPFPGLIYTRRVLAGQFPVINRLLVRKLQKLDLWSDAMRDTIISNDGSIQDIEAIPFEIRRLFKTVWEVDPVDLVRAAAARGPFVCQSQSMSLYFAAPTVSQVSSVLFQGWKAGLKTGVYYLRTKAATKPLPITLPVGMWNRPAGIADGRDDIATCTVCSA